MERQITKGTKIVLEPVDDSADLTEPLFAINWFNTRANWLYNLYNLIAARSVFRVGAAPFFKGHVTETLLGSADASRQVLLIVNYPSGERFLDLLSGRFFQVTSVLRLAAVRDFSFVLNTRVDGPTLLKSRTQQFDASDSWAVHHYSSSQDIGEELKQLRKITTDCQIDLHFASLRGALVYSEDGKAKRTAMNAVTDRVVLLRATTSSQLKDAILGPYSELIASVDNSYLGMLSRVM
ncbi:MAG: hypothetical protein ABJZ55_00865 [Fuerstiella sp.]